MQLVFRLFELTVNSMQSYTTYLRAGNVHSILNLQRAMFLCVRDTLIRSI